MCVQNWLGPDYEIVKKMYMCNNKCSFYLKRRFPSHGNVKQNGIWIRRLGSHVIFEFLFRQFAIFLEFAMLNINHFIYLKQDTINIFNKSFVKNVVCNFACYKTVKKLKSTCPSFLHWININIVLVEGFKFNNYMYNNIQDT